MGQHLGPAEGAYINTTKGKAMADSNVTASRGSADVKLLATCWTSAGDSSPLYDSKVSPVDVFARVESVARAGFKGMGLTHADVQAARDHHGSGVLGRLKQSCSNAGIEFFEIEFLTGWYSDDAELRRGAVLKLAELLAWAGELGAEQIKIGGSASVPGRPQPKVSMIGDAFGGICERAAAAGVRLALEPQPWTDIATFAAGLEIAQHANQSNGGLLIDAWHAYRGGWDLSAVAVEDGVYVVAVELDDADAEQVGTLLEDTINRRRLPGKGSYDVPGFIREMIRLGFTGYWGIEILSDEYRQCDVDVALGKVFEATMGQFELAVGPNGMSE
ncbi:MAG TPA: sugar phosphate isomerase/epimerase [Nocardioides sp.]|uniref:sugar phosphate isomerase/epimerase family protein n=1 Tax=uncultured Nocardioides sp. TaxID=198441 RepID=UPI00260D0D98|nr:sugar phosphate isomerase/epimerase [uncultured Nocardioides sp.]HRI94021.1 sugar phosphate isomerase/epimerase [Nocardioides sp.]HRK44071.1 sugar phosphate isomerase/epimerase [Nocardioides sp.]